MCHRVQCAVCGKASWEGCGLHVEQVLKGVAEADRCHCREKPHDHAERSGEVHAGESAEHWFFRRNLGE